MPVADTTPIGPLGSKVQGLWCAVSWQGNSAKVPSGWFLWWNVEIIRLWTEPRWAYLSRPLDGRPLVSVVSSRLTRNWTDHAAWLTRLRQALALGQLQWRWTVPPGTTTAPWVQHAAGRWRIPVLNVVNSSKPSRQPWKKWLAEIGELDRLQAGPILSLSPVVGDALAEGAVPSRDELPLRDRAAFALGDGVICLKRKPGGVVDQLWKRRLANPPIASWQCDLTEGSAVDWPAWDRLESPPRRPRIVGRLPWPALCHWTRAADGRWPGEPLDLWRDRVLLLGAAGDHGPLATLLAILRSGRLAGSRRGVRGGVSMVSWTAQRLENWPELRTFRRWRHRWDFEPYGIAVERRYVEQAGGRPVWYGSEADFAAATAEERSFGQPRRSGRSQIDWRREREWRSPGDFHFSRLPMKSVVVFVPSYESARRVAAVSKFAQFIIGTCPGSGGIE